MIEEWLVSEECVCGGRCVCGWGGGSGLLESGKIVFGEFGGWLDHVWSDGSDWSDWKQPGNNQGISGN